MVFTGERVLPCYSGETRNIYQLCLWPRSTSGSAPRLLGRWGPRLQGWSLGGVSTGFARAWRTWGAEVGRHHPRLQSVLLERGACRAVPRGESAGGPRQGRGKRVDRHTGCGRVFGGLFCLCSCHSRMAATLICLFRLLAQLMRLVFDFLKTVCAENTLSQPLCRWLPVLARSCENRPPHVLPEKALPFLLQVTLSVTQPSLPLLSLPKPGLQRPGRKAKQLFDFSLAGACIPVCGPGALRKCSECARDRGSLPHWAQGTRGSPTAPPGA